MQVKTKLKLLIMQKKKEGQKGYWSKIAHGNYRTCI